MLCCHSFILWKVRFPLILSFSQIFISSNECWEQRWRKLIHLSWPTYIVSPLWSVYGPPPTQTKDHNPDISTSICLHPILGGNYCSSCLTRQDIHYVAWWWHSHIDIPHQNTRGAETSYNMRPTSIKSHLIKSDIFLHFEMAEINNFQSSRTYQNTNWSSSNGVNKIPIGVQ